MNLQSSWNKSHQNLSKNKSHSKYAEYVLSQIDSGTSVCDIGGGAGHDAFYFAENGHRVFLVDISDFALEQAQRLAKEKGIESLETFQADLSSGIIPIKDNYVDVVYSRLALQYFNQETTTNLFKEIHRILKPNGKCFITLKSPEDKKEFAHLQKTAKEIDNGVFEDEGKIKSRFSAEQLKGMLTEAGIENAEVIEYIEDFSGRADSVKSGNTQMLLNQITFQK